MSNSFATNSIKYTVPVLQPTTQYNVVVLVLYEAIKQCCDLTTCLLVCLFVGLSHAYSSKTIHLKSMATIEH